MHSAWFSIGLYVAANPSLCCCGCHLTLEEHSHPFCYLHQINPKSLLTALPLLDAEHSLAAKSDCIGTVTLRQQYTN